MATPEELAEAKRVAAAVEAEFQMKDFHKRLRQARITLIVIGVLQILVGLWEAFGPMNLMLGLYIDGGIGVLFLALYVLSKSYPRPAVLAGLIIYLSIIILLAIADSQTLFQGLIMKGIIIALLVMGVIAAFKIPEEKKLKDDSLLDQ